MKLLKDKLLFNPDLKKIHNLKFFSEDIESEKDPEKKEKLIQQVREVKLALVKTFRETSWYKKDTDKKNIKRKRRKEIIDWQESYADIASSKRQKNESRETEDSLSEKIKQSQGERRLNDEKEEILGKQNMTKHHRNWLEKKTKALINKGDLTSLKQLNRAIDFTVRWGLIVHTSWWDLNFEPEMPKYDEIKQIRWIKKEELKVEQREKSGEEFLQTNFKAVEKIVASGKKICSAKQYTAISNTFPWKWFTKWCRN